MAVNIEAGLLAAVIRGGSLDAVVNAKLSEEFFTDAEHIRVWKFCLEHWKRYSKPPDREAVRRNFPTWKLIEPAEPLDYYIDELRERRRARITHDAVQNAVLALEAYDTPGALRAMNAGVQLANSQVSSLQHEVLSHTMGDRIAFYEDLAKDPGRLRGLSTGFRAIDRATRGIQAEQYIVLIGAQKTGKSTLLMAMAMHVNDFHDLPVLLISFEMSREEQQARHDALAAGVSHNRLLSGWANKQDFKKLRAAATEREEFQPLVMSTDITASTTVSGIRAQVEQIKPALVVIDGVYLMEDERGETAGSSQALTNISRDLKRMAQATRIPVVASTQALESKMSKRTGITAFSTGYSSAFGQDCDVMLGIQRIPDMDESELRVLLSRAGPLTTCRLLIDWDEGRIDELDTPDDDPSNF